MPFGGFCVSGGNNYGICQLANRLVSRVGTAYMWKYAAKL